MSSETPPQGRTPTGQWLKGVSGNPETQFQPGESGNPGGRPAKGQITKLLEAALAENEDAVKEQIVKTLTSRGMAGVLLLKEAAERLEGKVTQPVEGDVLVANVVLADIIANRRKKRGDSEPGT